MVAGWERSRIWTLYSFCAERSYCFCVVRFTEALASLSWTGAFVVLIPMVDFLLAASVRLAPTPLLTDPLGLDCLRPVLLCLAGPSRGDEASLLHALAPLAPFLLACLLWCGKAILSRLQVPARSLSVNLPLWSRSLQCQAPASHGAPSACAVGSSRLCQVQFVPIQV